MPVTRTYRAAIRCGEDFITVEEAIELPLDATEEDLLHAVDLGWRIYQAQREAVEEQIALAREGRGQPRGASYGDEPSPAQRNFINSLQEQLGWKIEDLLRYASEQKIDLSSMTKAQASALINKLKQLATQETVLTNIEKSVAKQDIPF